MASGRSLLFASTRSGTPASAGSSSSEWSSEVAVGSDFVCASARCGLRCGLKCVYSRRLRPRRICALATSSGSERYTHTIAFAPRQYLSHMLRNFGWPWVSAVDNCGRLYRWGCGEVGYVLFNTVTSQAAFGAALSVPGGAVASAMPVKHGAIVPCCRLDNAVSGAVIPDGKHSLTE